MFIDTDSGLGFLDDYGNPPGIGYGSGRTPTTQPWGLPNVDIQGGGVRINTGGGGINWMDIINRGFDVGSQAIGAWGRNPSQQVGNYATKGIGGGYAPAAVQQYSNPYANMTPAQQQALIAAQGGGVGSTVGSGVDGMFDWMQRNPLPVFLGIGAAFLLFMKPPGRR
jgi:hypothetical protein